MSQTLDRPPPAPSPSADERFAQKSVGARLLGRPEIGALVGAIVIFLLFFIVAPPFRDASSLATVLYQSSLYGIPAVGVALLMIGGEFDLSTGVAVTTSALVSSITAYQLSVNVWVGVLVSLIVALGIGALNGYLLVKTGLPSFLVTLATFFMLTGLNLAVTKIVSGGVATQDISNIDGFDTAAAIFASDFTVGGVRIRITLLYWLILVAIATVVLLRTRIGNWIYAAGGSSTSARAVGVPVRKVKIGLFMAVAFTVWFTGMHVLFAFNTVQSGQGVGNEFLYIIAAVVGGCLLTGGYGSAIGAAIGAFIFGMTEQGIVLAGWEADWFKFFLGAMLLFACLLNAYVRRRAETTK
jgi:simple sugar transport system permease protein